MCELLVGLPAVIVLGVVDVGPTAPLRVHVEMRHGRRSCAGCATPAWVKERPQVDLVDLPVLGRQARRCGATIGARARRLRRAWS
ncbi:MAG TPA: hypothetical protein VG078_02195 [Acidimicrobiales bacterium]|nr:hypothetical protein [Acidimicrobiales bacterium]